MNNETTIVKTTFQFRRDTSSEWEKYNPILAIGEPGFEIDTNRVKVGNGHSPWMDLSYLTNTTGSMSPDGNSLALNQNGTISLYGFDSAKTHQIPRKSRDSSIEWVNLSLRRDTEENYDKIQDSFIPANGEICLVDTKQDGLQVICGDGKTAYSQLKYVPNTLLRGYLHNNIFYKDSTYNEIIYSSMLKIYLDIPTSNLYIYDGLKFQNITLDIPSASALISGTVKLYNNIGINIDGTMTQKAISQQLKDKIEMAVDEKNETLVLDYNIQIGGE